jgi:hypothetical protein
VTILKIAWVSGTKNKTWLSSRNLGTGCASPQRRSANAKERIIVVVTRFAGLRGDMYIVCWEAKCGCMCGRRERTTNPVWVHTERTPGELFTLIHRWTGSKREQLLTTWFIRRGVTGIYHGRAFKPKLFTRNDAHEPFVHCGCI